MEYIIFQLFFYQQYGNKNMKHFATELKYKLNVSFILETSWDF